MKRRLTPRHQNKNKKQKLFLRSALGSQERLRRREAQFVECVAPELPYGEVVVQWFVFAPPDPAAGV